MKIGQWSVQQTIGCNYIFIFTPQSFEFCFLIVTSGAIGQPFIHLILWTVQNVYYSFAMLHIRRHLQFANCNLLQKYPMEHGTKREKLCLLLSWLQKSSSTIHRIQMFSAQRLTFSLSHQQFLLHVLYTNCCSISFYSIHLFSLLFQKEKNFSFAWKAKK